MSLMMNMPKIIEAPKKTRKRRESVYMLFVQESDDKGATAWGEHVDNPDAGFDSAEAVKKFVRDNELEGKFRIMRVVDEFTAEKATKVVMKIS